ncbi:GtrA family protein [Paenibacillus sp. P26]|nr:GtrA family protein [Paenibacillus sp. P26]UUZ94110.1 GtrA family protein [Paenibacillus sp. P25]
MWSELKKRWPTLLRFGVVGAVNTGIDFTVFTLLTLWGWSYLPAQCVSFTSGILNSYVMNRSWTFQAIAPAGRHRFLRFAALNLFILFMTSGFIALFHQAAGWPVLPSKLAASGLGVLVNYTGNRLWVFGVKSKPSIRSG